MPAASDDEQADQASRLVADILEAAGALRRLGDELAAAGGQTQARWQLLSVVSEGDWTVAHAARRLGVRRQSVQRVADLLLDEGFLRPETNPQHARSPLLRLTAAGRRALDAVNEVVDPWHRRIAAELSPEEIRAAREAVGTIIRIVRAEGSSGP